MFPRAWAKPGFLDPRTELPTVHTGQYRDSPGAPDVAGLPATSLLSPNQGPHLASLTITFPGSWRLKEGLAEPGLQVRLLPAKVSSKGHPDSFAS